MSDQTTAPDVEEEVWKFRKVCFDLGHTKMVVGSDRNPK